MSARSKLFIVTLSTVLLFYTVVGGFLAHRVTAKDNPYAQVVIFDEVLRHIVQDYVDEPDLEKVRVGALRGLAEGLDAESAYLTADQVRNYKAGDEAKDMTGLRLSKVAGYAYVVAVVKGSPADAAGIRSGDVIEYMGKSATRDLSLLDCRSLLAGAPGSEIDLSVFRGGKSEKMRLARRDVTEPPAGSRVEEGNVGYLHVTSLAKGRAAEIGSKLDELRSKGAQKFVLDLRGNASGELSEAAAVANLFIKSGVLAKELAKVPAQERVYEASEAAAKFATVPVVVLIDRSTAGPAEAIAAAFVDHKRSEVVGEKTFGSGSRQQLFSLHDGAALLLTTVRFASPSGKVFLEGGVAPTPGNEVARSSPAAAAPADGDDSDGEPEVSGAPSGASPANVPAEDKILKRGLEVLRGESPARKVAHLRRYGKHLAASRSSLETESYVM